MKHHPPDGAVRRARRLRRDMTDAERKLWRILRENFHEWHFRRQVPIRHFIADFASHRAKLIIEVDGGQHTTEIDAPRSAILEREGYRVIRFWNDEVLGNPDGVWTAIHGALLGPHTTRSKIEPLEDGPILDRPPHQGEGG